MEPESFFAASRLVIVAGKGGVGKTVVSAALARAAAAHGLRTLLVEASGTPALHRRFDAPPLRYEATELVSPRRGSSGSVTGRAITPDEALLEYLDDHGMRRVARRLARSGTLEVIAVAIPGIKDILVLGKVKQLVAASAADLVVVDAPAAGHAVGMLRAARALAASARSGPIRHQADQVLELLRDRSRCQVLLAAIPEETPVNELIETAYALEDEVGVRLGPVVVNGVYDEVAGLADAAVAHRVAARPGDATATTATTDAADAAELRLARGAVQRGHIQRLRQELPLEQIVLPLLFRGDDGPDDSAALAEHLVAGIRALPDHVAADG